MGRNRLQRPSVHEWIGADGTRYWKAEWRQPRLEGKPLHRSKTWLRSEYTKSKAQSECDAIVQRETGGELASSGLTVAEWWNRWWPTKQPHLSLNTRKQYESYWRTHLASAVGSKSIAAVTKFDFDALTARLAVTASAETISGILSIARDLFDEAAENGLIQRDPTRKVVVPRAARLSVPTRSLTESEVRRLLATAPEADRDLWRCLIFTGLRIAEVFGLRGGDILPNRRLRVERQAIGRQMEATKNRKSREIPLPLALWDSLTHRAAGGGGFLFPDAIGRAQRRQDVQDIITAARTASGISDLTFRMCRTTFATLYSGDVADAQAILGHHSPEFTVSAYRRAQPERQQATADDMERRLFVVPRAG